MLAVGSMLAVAHRPSQPAEALFGGKHSFVAKVTETNESTSSTSYIAKVTGVDGTGCRPFLAILTVNTVESPLRPGTTVRFNGQLLQLTSKEEVPHEIDYQKYLIAQGVTCRCMLSGQPDEVSPPVGLQALANRARDAIYNAIVDSPVSGPTAAFLVASVIGDRQYIPPGDYSAYRDTGVAHILALSGLHVGILASMLAFILFPLRLFRKGHYIGNLLTLLIIWAYAVTVGLTPSILRAAVMITVFVLAGLIGRGSNGCNSLSLAVTVILCADPMSLFSPGFQLSVTAVASILMFSGLLPTRLKKHPLLYFAASLVVTSVSAMIGTGIISAYYFNTFPVMFLAANIVTGILFPFILGGGILLAAFTAMGVSFGWLGAAVDAMFSAMQWCISVLGSADGCAFRQVYFSAWVILPYSIAVVLLALSLHRRKRVLWTMTAVMTVATFITASLTREHLPAAELYIPSSLSPASVIMRAGDKAWIYAATEQNGGSALQQANDRYRRFLLSRGCGESFITVTDSLNETTFKVNNLMIAAVDRTIAVVGRRMPDVSASAVHVDYALINADFRGTIERVNSSLRPDTILLAPDIHPSRRAALVRQCADTIPFRNLKHDGFSLVW